jgi:vesicle coat complex subunit
LRFPYVEIDRFESKHKYDGQRKERKSIVTKDYSLLASKHMNRQTFPDEPPGVQLQLLTATVKLFLRKPTEGPQAMIQLVLSNATSETDNPDLRDRAYIYWR